MVITPTLDNVLVMIAKVEKEQTTKSGIVIAGGAQQQEMPEQGVVIAVGPGRTLMNGEVKPVNLSIYSKVIFNKFAGTKVQDGDNSYLILKENDIIATIK